MRCLYCGKELALLKRLRGGGDFCSDAHKQSYQEEYNRLALSRLLQAQKKGKQTGNSPSENGPPPPNTSIALEEPVAQDEPVALEEPLAEETAADEVTVTAAATQVREITPEEAVPQAATESPEESSEEEETPPSMEPEPVESASFLLESPVMASGPDLAPCLETWLELSPGPAMSEWQIQSASFGLASGSLLSLDLRPQANALEQPAASTDLTPQAFAGAPPDLPVAPLASAPKTSNCNRFPAGSVISIQIAPSASALTADQTLAQALGFESTVLFCDSEMLQLSSTAIDFPAEDTEAVVLAHSASKNSVLELTLAETKSEAPGGVSPRASLEALSRLHQELVEQEAARVEEKPPEPKSKEVPVEVVRVVSVMVAPPQTAPEEVTAAASATVEIAVEQPEPAAPKPQLASDLFELSVKSFPPAKPALIAGEAFPSHNAPLLPQLKALPLRPKIALAPDYVPPGKATTETKPAVPASAPTTPAWRTQNPSKPVPVNKPAARLTQPKQPAPVVKPVPTAVKVASPKADTAKPLAKAASSQTAPVQEAAPNAPPTDRQPASKPAPVANQTKPAAEEPKSPPAQPKPPIEQAKSSTDQAKPPADQPKRAADPQKPAANQSKPTEQAKKDDQPKKDNVPSFGTSESANIPWLASLKVKLGIAILLLVIACAYFLGWGGKTRKTGGSNSAVSADGSGPSIIMGEGGWVEGWGGDPNGMHAGRQITIYRPSLKLSDYRFEFQGTIDTKSVGWVFRAADPENYYAMKLMTVSSGLSPKVALFKFLVVNGKQTQVGRVPIDLTVHADTVFDVRLDVRGPQFTTFIQGQQVDSWTDDQLKVGGAGFLNEREERGKVKSVSIRYLSGTGK
ncbi:MAG TPA: hypothetical protein VK686_19165 [Bryobacteraceae bacterium]|nr:hypothetical protein [Bryobacteraceae bacterium]